MKRLVIVRSVYSMHFVLFFVPVRYTNIRCKSSEYRHDRVYRPGTGQLK